MVSIFFCILIFCKKQKKAKKISALLFLLVMIEIQIVLNKITKMLVENEKNSKFLQIS